MDRPPEKGYSALKSMIRSSPIIFLLLLLPLVLIASFNYVRMKKELTEFALARRDAVSTLAAVTLKEKFDHMVDIGISFATRVQFRRLIAEGKWDGAIDILKRVPEDFPFVDRILLADPEGTLMADLPEVPEVHGKNFAFRDWYQGATRTRRPYISDVYKRTAAPQHNVVATAIPIQADDQTLLGILVLQLRLDTLLEWSRPIDVGPSGFIYIVDRKGNLAAHPKYPSQGEIVDISEFPPVQRMLRGEKGVGVIFNPVENEEQVVAYTPLEGYGWGVVVRQPTQAAFAPRDRTLRNILAVYGMIFLLNGFLAYLIVRTLAARRRSEDRIKKLNQELEAFCYSVSHDLRTPLRSIDGFGLALMEDCSDRLDETGKDHLRRVRQATQQMGLLIDDLLNLSKVSRSEINRERVDLSRLARTIAEEIRSEDPGRRVSFEVAEGLSAFGDERLLKIAIENLLRNAWKYTSKHPSARIECGSCERDGKKVYYVRDDGVGFDMAYAGKLFGAFQRLHKATEFPGTGIGLATVQRIVHRHGGEVWAEAEVEKGATFYFTL